MLPPNNIPGDRRRRPHRRIPAARRPCRPPPTLEGCPAGPPRLSRWRGAALPDGDRQGPTAAGVRADAHNRAWASGWVGVVRGAGERVTLYAILTTPAAGTHFWPLSRKRMPKQLLRIGGEDTLLEVTVARVAPALNRGLMEIQ